MEYTLKRSAHSRALRLSVHPDGSVVVTAPHFFGIRAIERFIAEHTDWLREKLGALKHRNVIRLVRGDIPALKKTALAFSHERCEHYARIYGVKYKKISIRAQRSRWGSCSVGGNLSFNYRIAGLPKHLADYVIVHEVCHLLELNHSRHFWAQVARTIPNHRELRKELRDILITFL